MDCISQVHKRHILVEGPRIDLFHRVVSTVPRESRDQLFRAKQWGESVYSATMSAPKYIYMQNERLKPDKASSGIPVRYAILVPLTTSVSTFLDSDRVPIGVYAAIFQGDGWVELVVVEELCFHPTINDRRIAKETTKGKTFLAALQICEEQR